MKYKLLALLAASLTMSANAQDKTKTPEKAVQPAVDETSTTEKEQNAKSTVIKSIAPVVKKFDGKKYSETEIKGNPDYFILYFTASW